MADAENDSLYSHVIFACVLFVALSAFFDVVRKRLWWVYEPRLHHAAYRARTPPAPAPGFFAWTRSVARLWDDDDFVVYGGVDGLVMIYFLRYAADQCLFAAAVGCGTPNETERTLSA